VSVGEKTVSSTNGVGKTRYPHVEDWNKTLSLLKKVNFKWTKDHNVRTELWNFKGKHWKM
jgi:hypothetical protein